MTRREELRHVNIFILLRLDIPRKILAEIYKLPEYPYAMMLGPANDVCRAFLLKELDKLSDLEIEML